MTRKWFGLFPVLMWGRGYSCVFPEGVEQPIWVPSRHLRALDAVKFLVAGVKRPRLEPTENPRVWPLKPVERAPRRRPPAQTSRRAAPPTWGQIKRLMQMSEEGARGLRLGNNPAAIFLMCLVIISIQVSPVREKAYWTYGPRPSLFHLVAWSHPSVPVYTNVILFGRVLL